MKKTISLVITVLLLATLIGCAENEPAAPIPNNSSAPESTASAPSSVPETPSSPETSSVPETFSVPETSLLPETSSAPETSSLPETPPETTAPSEQMFDNLILNIDRGTMYIRSGDSFSFTRHDGKEVDYEIKDNTLYINQYQDGEAVLTLPTDASYNTLQLTVGEGHVYAENTLSLQTLELNLTRGEANLSSVSVAESSTLDISQGSAFVHGDLGTSIIANSREGHLSIEVPNAQNDYNFDIQLTTGNIHLGNENYNGRSFSKNIDNGAERSMMLDCSRGDLSVEFNH